MRALVTGCAGFIGSHLADRLVEQGYLVKGIDSFTDYYSRYIKESNISNALMKKNFQLTDEDILNMESFPDVDYVFHLAAQAGVRASWGKSFEIYVRNNIRVTQKLLEYYKDKNIKNFVYSSSSSVYGDTELPIREDSMPKPVSPYGVTKLAAENLCYLYWKNYGIPIVSLRYFTVYGPRQRPDMAIHKFAMAILKNDEITIFGDGMQTRDFTFVDDVVEANLKAAQKNNMWMTLNIGGGSRISINELIIKLENTIGKKVKINYIEKQKGDVRDTWADTSKAMDLLCWRPKIDIDNGLRIYVKSI